MTARVGLVLWFFLLAPALVPVRTADAAMRPIGNRTELARLVLGLDVERAARRQMVERIAVERARLAEDRASAAAALEGRHLDGARAKEHLQNVSAARRTAAQEHAQARARVASLEDALKAAAGALLQDVRRAKGAPVREAEHARAPTGRDAAQALDAFTAALTQALARARAQEDEAAGRDDRRRQEQARAAASHRWFEGEVDRLQRWVVAARALEAEMRTASQEEERRLRATDEERRRVLDGLQHPAPAGAPSPAPALLASLAETEGSGGPVPPFLPPSIPNLLADASAGVEPAPALAQVDPAPGGPSPSAPVSPDEADGSASSAPAGTQRAALSEGEPVVAGSAHLLPVAGTIVRRFREGATGLLDRGITIEAAPAEPVQAPSRGKVVFAGEFKRYGPLLIIDHGNEYHTLLAGMSRIEAREGDRVDAGQVVGRVAALGEAHPHLYMELRLRGMPVNPLPWLAARADKVRG
ncbi:MAG: peptidoglycan DD-metalloendopeptidase family protein [Geminicoccaceae bacterium]|nr:peptidoglycan DD-metalloendopeptidase family protein [Geminicoccaceae bacterium]